MSRTRTRRSDDGQRAALADDLDTEQRRRLRSWAKAGTRRATPEERVWGDFRRLPYTSRQSVLGALDALGQGQHEAAPEGVSAAANPAADPPPCRSVPPRRLSKCPERDEYTFTSWTPVRLVTLSTPSDDQIDRGLLEIVGGGEPIRVERRINSICGRRRRAVAGTRELLRNSVTRLEQAGKIACAWMRPRAIEDRTIFLAGHPEVVYAPAESVVC